MIAILDYKAGNIASVKNSFNRLGVETILTNDAELLINADKVIIPGVGTAKSAMDNLSDAHLVSVIQNLKQPVLGICLGMQLLCSYSEEGNVSCLNLIPTTVKSFPIDGIVPHMGWNNFKEVNGELFNRIDIEDDMYFVHSYYVELCSQTIAVSDYILPFSAALQYENFYGTQFHPEKSGIKGVQILKNFLLL